MCIAHAVQCKKEPHNIKDKIQLLLSIIQSVLINLLKFLTRLKIDFNKLRLSLVILT